MRKNVFHQLSAFALLALCICSCSSKGDYTNVIPSDVTTITGFQLKTMAEKAGADEEENKVLLQKITNALKKELSASTLEQLEPIIQDPAQSGIDFGKPLYLLSSPAFETAVVAKLDSEKKFQDLLRATEEEQITEPVTETEEYSFTTIGDQTLLAFNASTLFVTNLGKGSQAEAIHTAVAAAFAQTQEQSFTANENFQKVLNAGGDFFFYTNMKAIPQEYKAIISHSLPKDADLEKIGVTGSLTFEKGQVVLNTENCITDPTLKDMLSKQAEAARPIRNTCLKYFPQSTLALLSVGMDGETLFEALQTNPGIATKLSMKQAEQLKQILCNFQDDFTVGLINVTMTNMPTFLAYAGAKNGDALKALYEQKDELRLGRKEDIIRLNDNEYVYKSQLFNLFYGVKDGLMYATNDELLYKNIGKPADPSAIETDYASAIKGEHSALIVNMEAVCQLPVMKMLSQYGRGKTAAYLSLCEKIAYLKIVGKGQTSTTTLQLEDKDTNALKQIVDAGKDLAGIQ